MAFNDIKQQRSNSKRGSSRGTERYDFDRIHDTNDCWFEIFERVEQRLESSQWINTGSLSLDPWPPRTGKKSYLPAVLQVILKIFVRTSNHKNNLREVLIPLSAKITAESSADYLSWQSQPTVEVLSSR